MIGRATFGRPWIFKEIRDYLDNTGAAPLTVDEKIDLLEEQLRINIDRIDEYRGILHTRRHLAASPIFKGIPDFKQSQQGGGAIGNFERMPRKNQSDRITHKRESLSAILRISLFYYNLKYTFYIIH